MNQREHKRYVKLDDGTQVTLSEVIFEDTAVLEKQIRDLRERPIPAFYIEKPKANPEESL